jgi:dynactin 1
MYASAARYDVTRSQLENLEVQLEDLKLQLDDALGAEEMLEALTERNLVIGEVRLLASYL